MYIHDTLSDEVNIRPNIHVDINTGRGSRHPMNMQFTCIKGGGASEI